ncbi:ubiquinol-cytochrome c reductase cytochrome b subunit [Actinocorallia lasiicapitis]
MNPLRTMFSQIALYSFVVLLATGAYLTAFYDPSMTTVPYDGAYLPLRDVPVSHAFDSTVHLSLDVRGGLLMRQLHHWAALLFVAAICLHLLAKFFGGHFRHWLLWVTLLPLAMVAALSGTILPDDLLSGGSLGLLQGVLQSIPLIGTRLAFWLFGDGIPGSQIIDRMYWAHLLLPLVIAGLLAVRELRERPRHSAAFFFAVCGVLCALATAVQINPIWKLGPSRPGDTTSGAVPGWYLGFLDGAIRIMPGWEPSVFGRPLTLAVLVPAVLVPGVFFAFLAVYPWLSRRLPMDRAATGGGLVAFYVVLWGAAANDQFAFHFHLSLYAVTWTFRVAVFAVPLLVYAGIVRIRLGLARREEHEKIHGRETGRIVMDAEGRFTELTVPLR